MRTIATTIVAVLLGTAAAMAADQPRKIDFSVVLTDQDDKLLNVCITPGIAVDADSKDCTEKRPMTLGFVASRALNAGEPNMDLGESIRRGQLAINVAHSSGAELTVEEIALIKKRIAAVWSPIVTARAAAILDPAENKKP